MVGGGLVQTEEINASTDTLFQKDLFLKMMSKPSNFKGKKMN
jgi:hypothetical protein